MSRHAFHLLDRSASGLRITSSTIGLCRAIRAATLCHAPDREYSGTASSHQPLRSCRRKRNVATRHVRGFMAQNKTVIKPRPVPVDMEEKLKLVQDLHIELDSPPTQDRRLPTEKEILVVFATYHRIVSVLKQQPLSTTTGQSMVASKATSAVLQSMNKSQALPLSAASVLETIANLSTSLMARPTIFLSALVLEAYVKLQARLNTPQNLASTFELYRTKAEPRPSDEPPYYTLKDSNPASPSVAIPKAVVDVALDAALEARDMDLALGIIDQSFGQKAYLYSTLIRSGTLPVLATLLTPVTIYVLATKFALLQQTMDRETATAFAAICMMTYVGACGSIGYIAFTTANDNMIRVQWVPGTPLWQRAAREDERRAADRVAQTWGFADIEKWGDEKGEEWARLKEWCGTRGFILDKVDLLPGMQ